KQANERAERRLLATETLAAVRALLDGKPFPVPEFTFAWRELLRCQPHDSICGCSCDEVHRDMLIRYESLDRTLALLENDAASVWAPGQQPTARTVIPTPLPCSRHAVVEPPGSEPVAVELGGFAAEEVQLTEAGENSRTASARNAIESDVFRVQAPA